MWGDAQDNLHSHPEGVNERCEQRARLGLVGEFTCLAIEDGKDGHGKSSLSQMIVHLS